MKSLAVLSSVVIALAATPAVAKSTHHKLHAPRYGYTNGYKGPYNYYAPYRYYAPNEVGTTYVPGFGNIGAGAGPGEDWK
jgi:hypothetical protein